MPSQKRQLAAIMFIDIVGYSTLMGHNEEKAIENLQKFKSFALPLVLKNDGKWLKDLGDGALCSFNSAFDSVNCAIALQHQSKKELSAYIRIGIHSGDVTYRDGDIFGDGVNIASRIQSEAAQGGVCLSETVFKSIRNKDGIEVAFLGTRKLKNIEGQVKLYQITNPGIGRINKSPGRVIKLWKAVLLSIGLALFSSLILVSFFLNKKYDVSRKTERYDLTLPEEAPIAYIGSAHFGVGQTALTVSPDGNLLAYAGQERVGTRLFLRHINSFEVQVLEGTEGAIYPFFSPDGMWIGFFAGNFLKKISIKGGKPIVLCGSINPFGALWMPDDRIIFADNEATRLMWIKADGGEQRELVIKDTSVGVGAYSFPNILNEEYIVVHSLYPKGINVISLESGQIINILDYGYNPKYLPTNHLSFVDHGRLLVVPFDINSMTISGKVVPVIEDLRTEETSGQFCISNKGDLIYAPGISGIKSELVTRSIHSHEENVLAAPGYYGQFQISKDGKYIAMQNASNSDIYVHDITNNNAIRITNEGNSINVIWGPGAFEITYNTFNEIYKVKASGMNKPTKILQSNLNIFPWDWSSDGNTLMYGENNLTTAIDIKFYYSNDFNQDITLQPNKEAQILASFSPLGDFVAYTSRESGQDEIYIQPFPFNGERWLVSSNGAEEPVWSHDGRKIYFRNGQEWYEVEVSFKPDFSIERSQFLFSGPYRNVPGYSYDLTPDGKKFLLLRPISKDQTTRNLKVIKNWFEEVNQLAPPK
jgi:Tol biopolymer transport system component